MMYIFTQRKKERFSSRLRSAYAVALAMAKYHDIAQAIQARIEHGDYRLRGFPSYADLVTELGVNSRTVTRALATLVDQGVLERQSTGRLSVRAQNETRERIVGVLMPDWPSTNIMQWCRLISELCQKRGWRLKPVIYNHWHDMAITESLRGMDGLFFISLGDDIPPAVVEQIRQSSTAVVVLEQDISSTGIPCLRYWNPNSIELLINHLIVLGHRRVACLNTQPSSNVIRERIAAWRLWSSAHGVQGPLIDEPVNLYEPAEIKALDVIRKLLAENRLDATALICTTPWLALGAMRAIVDTGRKLGRDIAVCSVEEWTGMAPVLCPSLTCLTPPPMEPLLQVCMDYFEQQDPHAWLGSVLVQPAAMKLFVGESTLGF